MKRVLPFLLSLHMLFVGLLPGADAHILLDTAAVQEHYDEDHVNTSFWAFLYNHYIAGKHLHPDCQGCDDQDALPCHHTHTHGGSMALVAFFHSLLSAADHEPQYADASVQTRLVTPMVPNGVTRQCWQPPRA